MVSISITTRGKFGGGSIGISTRGKFIAAMSKKIYRRVYFLAGKIHKRIFKSGYIKR